MCKRYKTIEKKELMRLAATNSPDLPQAVVINGRRWLWVGIGWIDAPGAIKGLPVVIENGKTTIKGR